MSLYDGGLGYQKIEQYLNYKGINTVKNIKYQNIQVYNSKGIETKDLDNNLDC